MKLKTENPFSSSTKNKLKTPQSKLLQSIQTEESGCKANYQSDSKRYSFKQNLTTKQKATDRPIKLSLQEKLPNFTNNFKGI